MIINDSFCRIISFSCVVYSITQLSWIFSSRDQHQLQGFLLLLSAMTTSLFYSKPQEFFHAWFSFRFFFIWSTIIVIQSKLKGNTYRWSDMPAVIVVEPKDSRLVFEMTEASLQYTFPFACMDCTAPWSFPLPELLENPKQAMPLWSQPQNSFPFPV